MDLKDATIRDLLNELSARISEVQARFAVDAEAMQHLREIYGIVYGFGIYDPDNSATAEQAKRLMPHIHALNEKWRFKP